MPYSVATICTECSLWSMWLTSGTMVEILPPLAEDGQVRVAREVARAADAVHHLASHHVRAVHVAEDIHFNRGVDGDDAQTADHFRVVADFLGPQQDARAEPLQVVVDRS